VSRGGGVGDRPEGCSRTVFRPVRLIGQWSRRSSARLASPALVFGGYLEGTSCHPGESEILLVAATMGPSRSSHGRGGRPEAWDSGKCGMDAAAGGPGDRAASAARCTFGGVRSSKSRFPHRRRDGRSSSRLGPPDRSCARKRSAWATVSALTSRIRSVGGLLAGKTNWLSREGGGIRVEAGA